MKSISMANSKTATLSMSRPAPVKPAFEASSNAMLLTQIAASINGNAWLLSFIAAPNNRGARYAASSAANAIFAAAAIELCGAERNVARAITQSPTSTARRRLDMGPSWLPATTARAKPNSNSCACPVADANAGNAHLSLSIANTEAGKMKIA